MPNTPSGSPTAWANSRTPAATVHTRRGGSGSRSDLATSSASCSKTPALNRSHSPGSREGGNSPGSARTARTPSCARHHRRALRDLAAEAAWPLNDVQIARGRITAGDVSQEGLGVPACRRENGDDVARMRPLNVIARSAVVPDQPAGVRGDAPGGAHEDRRIRARAGCHSERPRPAAPPRASAGRCGRLRRSRPRPRRRDRHAWIPRAAWRPNCANLPVRERQAPMRSRSVMASHLMSTSKQNVCRSPAATESCTSTGCPGVVVDRPQDAEDGNAWRHLQCPRLVRCWHPARYLVDRTRDLPANGPGRVLDDRVRAAPDQVRLLNRSIRHQVCREVAVVKRYRAALEQEGKAPYDHLRASRRCPASRPPPGARGCGLPRGSPAVASAPARGPGH